MSSAKDIFFRETCDDDKIHDLLLFFIENNCVLDVVVFRYYLTLFIIIISIIC